MSPPFDVLYVTSFTPELYAKTGNLLVRSFLESDSDGQLLVCHEGGMAARLSGIPNQILRYDLDESSFLTTWLAANRDIIPAALGGAALGCACDDPNDPFGRHQAGCVFQWFNKNASRWFRKIVALDAALQYANGAAIVWIDCDCRFLKRLPTSVLLDLFGQASVLYHKGPDRSVVESGVIAFKLDADGRRFLTAVIERFRTGDFRRDIRWDDGFQFQVAIDAMPDVSSKDLGGRATGESGFGHVLPGSPLGEYIRHRKGVHGMLKLMS